MSLSPFDRNTSKGSFLRAASLLRAENQIGVSDRVIRWPVGQEHHVKIDRQESLDAFLV